MEAAAEPKQTARPRGLWGVAFQAPKPGLGVTPDVDIEPAEHAESSQPEEAPCRGTSLVGSGISMSALSNAFQVWHCHNARCLTVHAGITMSYTCS